MDPGSDHVMVEDWLRGAANSIATDLVAADPFAVLAEQLASAVTTGKIDPATPLLFRYVCVVVCMKS